MFECNYFEEIIDFTNKEYEYNFDPEIMHDEDLQQREYNFKEDTKKKYSYVYTADFESFTVDKDFNEQQHEEYLICY